MLCPRLRLGRRDCLGRLGLRARRRLRVAPRSSRPQAAKFAGGHRIRVTPVPIPNTEVKPDTADGTVWETVWESRSLPALIVKARSSKDDRAFFLYAAPSGLTAAGSAA